VPLRRAAPRTGESTRALADPIGTIESNLYHETQTFSSFSDLYRCFICLWYFVRYSKRQNQAKHSSKITKARAEQIALTKVPRGSIRSAELETVQGHRFWSVYIAKPGSKNAKEIRVDSTSGQILAVQTERPEDQAEEPPKTH
jgi:hypothetical protein